VCTIGHDEVRDRIDLVERLRSSVTAVERTACSCTPPRVPTSTPTSDGSPLTNTVAAGSGASPSNPAMRS
jgi:hypothetical protein